MTPSRNKNFADLDPIYDDSLSTLAAQNFMWNSFGYASYHASQMSKYMTISDRRDVVLMILHFILFFIFSNTIVYRIKHTFIYINENGRVVKYNMYKILECIEIIAFILNRLI